MRRTLQWLLPLAALALLALVGHDFAASRLDPERRRAPALPVLPEDIQAQAQSWNWSQTSGDAMRIEVSADDFAQAARGAGADLTGVVLRIHRDGEAAFDRVESQAMRLLASGELFSEGETTISIGVPEDAGGPPSAVVVTSGVTFRPDESSARTDQVLEYRFAGGSGSSVGAVYNAGSGHLELLSQVRIFQEGRGSAASRSTITAGTLRYLDKGGRVELSGGARIDRGPVWLQCSSAVLRLESGRLRRVDGTEATAGEVRPERTARFEAASIQANLDQQGALERVEGRGAASFRAEENGQQLEVSSGVLLLSFGPVADQPGNSLRSVSARDHAIATLMPGESGLRTTLKSEALRLHFSPLSRQAQRVETLARGSLRHILADGSGPTGTLDADRIELLLEESGQPRSVAAAGRVALEQPSGTSGGGLLRTWSDILEAQLDPETAGIESLLQQGGFRFEDLDSRGSASRARFEPTGGVLKLEGGAMVDRAGTTLSAKTISVDRDSGKLQAEGSVAGSVEAASGDSAGPEAPRLFSGDAPLFFAAGRLVSDPGPGLVQYLEGARLWQSGSRLDAGTIQISQQTGRVTAKTGVAADWAEAADEEGESGPPTRVRADRMVYADSTGAARFSGSVEFRKGTMLVSADVLTTVLGTGEESGMDAVAEGSVRIADPPDGSGTRGFGDKAEFGATRSEIILTGEPARIVAADGTRSEGASLTYRPLDASLLLLGRDGDRAYTQRPLP